MDEVRSVASCPIRAGAAADVMWPTLTWPSRYRNAD